MTRHLLIGMTLAISVLLIHSCGEKSEPATTTAESAPEKPAEEAKLDRAPESEAAAEPGAATTYPTRVFFGDTHLHTSFSMDAGLFGATTTPDDAYRFAKGETVTSSTGLKAKLDRPLDFLVVADHSENLGFFRRLAEGDPKVIANEKGKQWYEGLKKGGEASVAASLDLIKTYSQGEFPDELVLEGEELRPMWMEIIDAAEKHNAPGTFTSFIGYEWTSMPDAKNLHRVVIFEDGKQHASQVVPFTAQDSDDPEKLWDAMDAYTKKTGGRVLAIPHNGNLSNGQMFAVETQAGKPFDRAYAERRIDHEPLYEITQIKGDGEAHPFLSPNDEFADFEQWDVGNLDLSAKKENGMLAGEYAREALKQGLAFDKSLGVNPFKFGVIGSTDSHTGLATADDDLFFGKHSGAEPSAERASHAFIEGKAGKLLGWQMVASGYAAVWARENTREALFEAMMRKETYATTGPRMTLRVFGGWDFADADLSGDYVAAGYGRGVPMGGNLKPAGEATAPTFLVAALKEADGANLDRVQIIKGWLDAGGKTHEKVFDVVWGGERKPDANGKLPAVGDTVNTEACTYDNSIGAGELSQVWTDPEFDASQRAFYYVRVLEIPTPRWTCYDAKEFDIEMPEGAPLKTQQRAYSSPIWYTPGA